MSPILEMPTQDEFDALLDGVLAEGNVDVPGGLVQRLDAQLAREIAAAAVMFVSAMRLATRRSSRSLWTALGLHAAVIALIALVVAQHVSVASSAMRVHSHVIYLEERQPVELAMQPAAAAARGGGGNHDLLPTARGRLPQFTREQLLAPKVPPTIDPRLAVEPTLVAESTPKLADNKLPDLGAPNSSLHGYSLGANGGNGIGPGSGNGAGAGANGGYGSGIYHPGGAVRAPEVLKQVEPEFSEEARKAKFSGNVEVYLVVDETGMPTHVRVVRDVGMGLGQKAVEAVEQYRFKPALLNGRPVKADMYVLVDFQIF